MDPIITAATPHLVDRETEWELTTGEITARLAGRRHENSVINLYGPEGLGKSTFLRDFLWPYLESYEPRLAHAIIDFDATDLYTGPLGRGRLLLQLARQFIAGARPARQRPVSPEELAGQARNLARREEFWPESFRDAVARWAEVETAGSESPPSATAEAEELLVRRFNQDLIPHLIVPPEQDPRPVVVLMDSAERLSIPMLEWFQDKIQSPTTYTGYVLYVMASHFRLECYPFYLRDNFKWHRMAAFTPAQVREQVERQAPWLTGVADRIYDLSYGLPEATREVIDGLMDLSIAPEEEEAISAELLFERHESDLVRVVARLKERYLADITDERVLAGMTVLSPFRLFNVSIVNQLLPDLMRDYLPEAKDRIDPTRFIRLLQKTKRIVWNHERNGYVIEEPVRQIVARVFAEQQPQLFRTVHERALQKYNEWRENIPEKRKDYTVEAMYHQAVLTLSAGGEQPDGRAIAQLRAMVRETVGRHYPTDDEQKINATLTKELREKINDDTDLRLLLGNEGIEEILGDIPERDDQSFPSPEA